MGTRPLRAWAPALWLAPSAVGVVLFFVTPLLVVIWLTTQSWNLLSAPTWVGTANLGALADPRFTRSLVTTFTIGAGALVVEIVVGFVLAQALARNSASNRATMVLLLLPWMMAPLALGVVARWFLSPSDGLIASVIGTRFTALDEPMTAVMAVTLVVAWQATGFAALVYSAALRAIPREVHAAAALDGLGSWGRWWRIDWPLVAPTSGFLLVAGVPQALGLYDLVVALTGGGPGSATETVAMRVVQTAWNSFDVGSAAVIAVALTVIGTSLAATVVVWLRRRT